MSIRIFTYNIYGFIETKSDYSHGLLDSHDIVMLQGHWLYDRQTLILKIRFLMYRYIVFLE